MKTAESEFLRVVGHEGGHVTGMMHEHQRPEIIALLDEYKVIAGARERMGWDEATSRSQILTAMPLRYLTATSTADQKSLMCYSLPVEWTKSGKPIVGGVPLSPGDIEFCAKLYPPIIIPPKPPVEPTDPPQPPPDGKKKMTRDQLKALLVNYAKAIRDGARWLTGPLSWVPALATLATILVKAADFLDAVTTDQMAWLLDAFLFLINIGAVPASALPEAITPEAMAQLACVPEPAALMMMAPPGMATPAPAAPKKK